MKLPESTHEARPWRIHALLDDFELEDVWTLPTPGGPDDFALLVKAFAMADPAEGSSAVVRALFALRWKIGALLGWDSEDDGLGARVSTLRRRLPADLAATEPPAFDGFPFEPLYVTDDEFAAEIANRTMHGVLHLGWVPDDAVAGGFRGEMAVYVKRNGLFGRAYMAAIRPFRHWIVYPQMLGELERTWKVATAAKEVVAAGE